MGLLEKALQYKKEMNERGKETLLDRIKGPAETEFLEETPDARDRKSEIHPGEERMAPEKEKSVLDDNNLILDEMDRLMETKEERTDITDDLFILPDDDAQSPRDVLEAQKRESHAQGREPEKEKGLHEEMGADLHIPGSSGEAEPLGPDDEPVLNAAPPAPVSEEGKAADKIAFGAGTAARQRAEMPGLPAAELGGKGDAGGEGEEAEKPVEKPDKKFQDFMVLYEIGKEIVRAGSRKELYDVILFSIMGQIGASSSSIMITDPRDQTRWIIADSRGVTIKNRELHFNTGDGILGQFIKTKGIVDIEKFKSNPEHRDEYYQFISIDARLLSPLSYDGDVFGAIVLGDKITIGDYSEEEKDFILSVSEISAIALQKINALENLKDENQGVRKDLGFVHNVDEIQDSITTHTDLKRVEEVILSAFEELGIISYSVFIGSMKDEKYIPLVVERDDFLSLRGSGFSISYGNPFIAFVKEIKDNVRIEEYDRLKVIKDAFGENYLKKMSLFWIYPFKLGNQLEGFLILFRVLDRDREGEIDSKMRRLSRVLFSYILNIRTLDLQENRYIDNIEMILRRINGTLVNARNLKIPLTLVLFSIKNFKRYYNLFGYQEAGKLIERFEEIIRIRLSDTDFAVRYDRNKILIVLPGKNKKYAVPLSNTIRNEILQWFKQKDMQLLVTFLTAEYPEDGEDLYTLLDSID